ncbi:MULTISPECIES: hypothetical protein [unclassified Streptomyces]|uniref:hypothetical protein n=1 Tax=unclassified Streptomyces TaxID=2593676 RepID=UPI002DDB5268|nr:MULTISPECIES: hypothetical protein [unclassified Streptomyces]WSS46780.1 hypothetical protein OG220_40120 [Streptomyces sp. NBC_01187]WSA97701.1 hypothetical protein OIE63_40090 [Streptomyces sp. NBC_01795]WSB82048.1 hypothetical protein OHB04_40720 [Streptomyces sp. NBC_01775]WSS18021.1 hypothetical protein OG533_39800 [Streptomyces sp. NBC_01186]WSS47003.1 hypothetical protein OG220_41505 [Streptomyces sp. NBC_01187]
MARRSEVDPSVSGFKPGDLSRAATVSALALVAAAVVMLFVPVSSEGVDEQTPSCGSIAAPADELRYGQTADYVACNTRHIRQIGYVGLILAGAIGCTVLSFLTRVEGRGTNRPTTTEPAEQ